MNKKLSERMQTQTTPSSPLPTDSKSIVKTGNSQDFVKVDHDYIQQEILANSSKNSHHEDPFNTPKPSVPFIDKSSETKKMHHSLNNTRYPHIFDSQPQSPLASRLEKIL